MAYKATYFNATADPRWYSVREERENDTVTVTVTGDWKRTPEPKAAEIGQLCRELIDLKRRIKENGEKAKIYVDIANFPNDETAEPLYKTILTAASARLPTQK
ncbi:hypothetical protein HY489_05085 [Candidatus Woesearchaeota archaeon]|nr:hypothetical protein [Candidatus Woesearchaeota archaeon]